MVGLTRWFGALAGVGVVGLVGGAVVLAGDIDPPAGPVGPTMKTLEEVEPRTAIHQADVPVMIVEPGSYYLAENLTFPAATSGFVISITVDDVTLDLNGFTIDGQDSMGSPDFVIGIGASGDDAVIRNGAIVNAAIGITAQSERRVSMDALRVVPTEDGTGIETSNQGTVTNCEVIGGAIGVDMTVTFDAVVRDCVVRDVSDAGFHMMFTMDAQIERCVVYGGSYGFRLTDDNVNRITLMDCVTHGSSIGISDLSGGTNYFYRNVTLNTNVPNQNVPNVSTNPATAGPWDNIRP